MNIEHPFYKTWGGPFTNSSVRSWVTVSTMGALIFSCLPPQYTHRDLRGTAANRQHERIRL